MNLTVNSQRLAKELRLVNTVVKTKPAIPILSHVLLKAMDHLSLYATDLEVGLSTTCQATINDQGIAALPAAKLLQMVEQFPDATVSIQRADNAVLIKCGFFSSQLRTLPVDDFPHQPPVEGLSFSLNNQTFKQMIARTRYAISETSNRHLFQGGLLTLTGTVGALVTTDNKRLSLTTVSRTGPDARIIVPRKALDVINALEGADIDVTVGEYHLFFQSGDRLMVSQTIEGEFPKYERIIPRKNELIVTINRSQLAAAVRRTGLAAEQHQAAYFAFEQDSLLISTSSVEFGLAEEPVACQYAGPSLKLCLNWKHVLDFLEAAVGEVVSIAMKDEKTATLFSDGDDFINVILPMRG